MKFIKEQKPMTKKTPDWLSIGPDAATVKLSRPTVLNGVKQDTLVLRTPTVGDLRAAAKRSKDDTEEQDIFLFAALAECAPGDIERLCVRDYNRVKESYFRLVSEDDGSGTEAGSPAAGD
ncbi:MAG: phage tail assembly protein [Desulfobulbus sp.]|nr:phage tail assembly protein [Desulfobulbus sp.]